MSRVACLAVAAAVFIGVSSNNGYAQATTSQGSEQGQDQSFLRSVVPFLEGTDVFLSDEGDLRFEAALFPHLVAWQNFSQVLDGRTDASPKSLFWIVTGTPAVRLRMFDETSAPVRTPSYMPRGSIQLLYSVDYRCALRRFDNALDGVGGADGCESTGGRRPTVSVWELHLIVGHHSNGQAGCLYAEQQRDSDGRCAPSFTDADGPGTVNKVDGSFSTNYVRLGTHWRKNWLGPEDNGSRATLRELTLGGSYQRQFKTDDQLRPFYSARRLTGTVSIAQAGMLPGCKARLEEAAGATLQLDHPVESVRRASFWVQVSCFPQARGSWGFFVRGYTGEDYYNLGFLENITRLQFGVTFNPNGFLRFTAPKR